MNPRLVAASICRACGQRSISSSSRSSTFYSRPSSTTSPRSLAQRNRLLSSTSHAHAQPVNDISSTSAVPPSDPIPTSIPPLSTPTDTNTSPSAPQTITEPQKQSIATITSIHNLTARATFTKQHWDPKFHRYFTKSHHVLVHDPFSSGEWQAQYTTSDTPPTTATVTETPASPPSPSKSIKSPKSTPSQLALSHQRPSLLRVGDVISYHPLSPSQLSHRAARKAFFNDLELVRKQRTAGKHAKQVLNDHIKAKAKRTRTNRGVRFVVGEVVSPFGEGLEERMQKLGLGRGVVGREEMGSSGGVMAGALGGVDQSVVEGGERMAWWKRREQRGGVVGKRGKTG